MNAAAALLGDGDTVKATHPLPNVTTEGPRRRFRIDDKDYLTAERQASAAGLALLGFYHSHPDHPAVPSQYDLDHAWPTFVYPIVSVMAGEAVALRAWMLRDDRTAFDERPVESADPRHNHASLSEDPVMPVSIHIPTPLRPFTEKLDVVQASGATVGEVLQDLTTR